MNTDNDEVDTRWDYEPHVEETDDVCPECGSNKMIRYMQLNGPDDYCWIYSCRNCGATQSTWI